LPVVLALQPVRSRPLVVAVNITILEQFQDQGWLPDISPQPLIGLYQRINTLYPHISRQLNSSLTAAAFI